MNIASALWRTSPARAVRVVGLLACLGLTVPALAQGPRQDAIWARRTTSAITLNGILSEPAWAKAESVIINFGVDNGIPGSGWKYESGVIPNNPTHATLKFLVAGNQLYLGARVPDQSVGGDSIFNRFDGLLMALKDRSDPNFPKPPAEYLYSWWYPGSSTPRAVGNMPVFKGRWGNEPPGQPRTAEEIANWDAVTVVNGITNQDTPNDVGYTVEMRFNLTPMGYNVTDGDGDIIEWNISIYDCDWFWPLNVSTFASNRVWWQSPWGNAMWYDEVHIYARPDVHINSTVLPTIRPEVFIPNGAAFPAPTIDGNPNEAVWNTAYTFAIRFGDNALRATYPGVGPWRSGQFQPNVNGGQAFVADPADATVKVFFRDNNLFMSFDVNDQVVQYHPNVDRWDGFIVSINDRVERDLLDNVLKPRRLSFQVSAAGTASPQDYLATLVTNGNAQVVLTPKAGTTVDTLGANVDTGYRAELRVNLNALGYPPGLGDGFLFLGVDHLDGDSFVPFTDSYGTRTWWFREYEGQCCPVWAYMAPTPPTDTEPGPKHTLDGYVLFGNSPNPAPFTTIRYGLPQSSQVTFEVFDVAGKLVERRELGVQLAGRQETFFDGSQKAAGLYLYRLQVADPTSGAVRKTLSGRMVVTH